MTCDGDMTLRVMNRVEMNPNVSMSKNLTIDSDMLLQMSKKMIYFRNF